MYNWYRAFRSFHFTPRQSKKLAERMSQWDFETTKRILGEHFNYMLQTARL